MTVIAEQTSPRQNIGAVAPDCPVENQRAFWHGLAFILMFNGLLCVWLLLKPGSKATFAFVDNLAQVLGHVLILPWCFLPFARRRRNATRVKAQHPQRTLQDWSPLFLGLGMLGYAIGQGIWTYYEHILHRSTPFPSWADAGFLCEYPCLLIGILLMPTRRLPLAARIRAFLDSLMTMTAMVTFSWYFVLGPTLLKGSETTLGKILGAAYPMCDLVLIFCVLMLLYHSAEATLRRAAHLLTLGLSCIIVSDTLFAYQTLHGTYATGHLLDIGWPLGGMLIGLSARLLRLSALGVGCWVLGVGENPIQEKGERKKEKAQSPNHPTTQLPNTQHPTPNAQRPILWRSLLPYALVPAVGALILYTGRVRGDGDLEKGVTIGAAVLIGLVLLRQVFAILENGYLYRYLQETYKELEQTHRKTAEYAERQEQLNAELTAIQAELLENNEALSEANLRLESLATTDGLTGLKNHRAFQEHLRVECANAKRYGQSLALLLIDADHFKRYNDTFGHPSGDDVLRTVGQLLQDTVRQGDFVARYGGEEFAALLPHTDEDTALRIAERIRATVALYAFPHCPITLSIGLTCLFGDEADAETLLLRTDQALYTAKNAGRNRVAVAGDIALEPVPTQDENPVQEVDSTLLTTQEMEGQAEPLPSSPVGWDSLEGLLQEPPGQILSALLAALDLRDTETEGHSQRVVRFALCLAQQMQGRELVTLTPGDLHNLVFGALLHDIGKIGVPDAILHKPGPLSAEEWVEMRKHPLLGYEMLKEFAVLTPALPIVRHHHERWDGAGYPDRLAAEDIPLTARIFALADTLDAMSSDRPYRRALPYAFIRDEIAGLTGKQFDPAVVEAFLAIPEDEWERLRHQDAGQFTLFAPPPLQRLRHAA